VLFALNSLVVTPGSSGAVDQTVQSQLQQEASDTVVIAADEGELSRLLRYWNDKSDVFQNQSAVRKGRYDHETFANETRMNGAQFGAILERRFWENGRSYNVVLTSRNESDGGTDSQYLVYEGEPGPNAFTASYVVTLYDDQTLTAPGYEDVRLEEVDEDEYGIQNVDGPVYNVVEVRLVVW
jgi:hypothetical protein